MLSLHKVKKVLNPVNHTNPEDDFRILDSWPVYEGSGKNEKLKYLCYKIETMDPETGKKTVLFKALKFARVERLPKSARQSTSFMDMHSQVLSGAYERGYNLVTVIANVIRPVSEGLLFLYGVQGVSDNLEDAQKRADLDYTGFINSMMGTYMVLHMRQINSSEGAWLSEKMRGMKFMTAVRGIPRANSEGMDMGNKGIGGANLNPDSQGTLEEIITAMADYEYVIQVLSTPVYPRTLMAWATQTEKQMTEWNEQLQGTKSLSFNLSIPMTYMTSTGNSQGWSKNYTDSETVSYTNGESYNTGFSQNVGHSISESLGESFGLTKGSSLTDSVGENHSVSQGITRGQTVGVTEGITRGQTIGETIGYTQGITRGYTQGITRGQSVGVSSSNTQGNSLGTSLSSNRGISLGQNLSESMNRSFSSGLSRNQSMGTSESQNMGRSFGQSLGNSMNKSFGESSNLSHSAGYNQSDSYGSSTSANIGGSHTDGISSNRSTSANQGISRNDGLSHTESMSHNESQSENHGQSQNNSTSHSDSHNQSDGYGLSHSDGGNWSRSKNLTDGSSEGGSSSNGTSTTDSNNRNKSASVAPWGFHLGGSYGEGHSEGVTDTISDTYSTSHSFSKGGSQGGSWSDGTSTNHSASDGYSDGYSNSYGTSDSYGNSYSDGISVSNGRSQSVGQSASVGVSRGVGESHSDGTSWGRSVGDNESHSAGLNESYSAGQGASYSEGYGASYGTNQGMSYSNGTGRSQSESIGQNTGLSSGFGSSKGSSYGETAGSSTGQNLGQSYSMAISKNQGASISSSMSQSVSQSESMSRSLSQSESLSQSYSQSTSESVSQSQSESSGTSRSRSVGQSESASYTQSVSNGIGKNWGESQSVSQGVSKGKSEGISHGTSIGNTGTFTSGTSGSMGLGPSIGYSKSYQWMDQQVKDILELLEYQNERLKKALRGNGAFYTYVYIACPSMEALSTAQAAAKATWQNKYALSQPIQALDLTDEEQEHLLYHFRAFSADVTRENIAGVSDYKYATVLLSEEYVAYTHLPRISEGGIDTTIDDIPKFRVPGKLYGNIYMGTQLNAERYTFQNGYRTQFDYRIKIDELMHGVFTGQSRSGKTVAAMRFIRELANSKRSGTGKRLRIVIMDPKQDWRGIARFVEPERFRFYSLGNTHFHPIALNPCKIPYGVEPQHWIDGIINIYCRAYGLLERGKQMLSDIFYELYTEAGVFPKSNESFDEAYMAAYDDWSAEITRRSAKVTFHKAYKLMESKNTEISSGKKRGGNDTLDAYSRLLERLSCFNRPYSIEYRLFSAERSLNGIEVFKDPNVEGTGMGIDELIGGDDVTVFESFGLESTFANFIFGIITSGFYKVAKGFERGYLHPSQYETVLVIEEANKVLTGNDTAGTGGGGGMASLSGQSEFEEILDQSAGYGLFIIAITQKISMMPSSIIANCGLFFMGKLSQPDDVNLGVRMIGREERIDDRDIVKFLPKCPTGWFICRSNRGYDFRDAEPVLVQIEPLNNAMISNAELNEILVRKDIALVLNGSKAASA